MQKRLPRTLRRLALDTAAAEVAEAAVVFPVLFMVLIGIFWFGQAFRIYGTLTHAAREGARAAAMPICSTCSTTTDPSTAAFNAVQKVLVAGDISPSKLQRPARIPAVCACGSSATTCTGGSTVDCDTSQPNICVQGVSHSGGNVDQDNIQISANGPNGAGVCGVSVSFQYPYQFWLPFTSLNMQIVNLQAQAQARVETQ
jgi:Flp pilus assembly protein TadG